MSASEKLKVLEEAQREFGWPGPPVRTLFDALPQIVAVVEAAEMVSDYSPTITAHTGSASARFRANRGRGELAAALSALDEALT